MCGIAGKIYFDQQQVSEEDLLKMTAAVAHRGPEAEKIYLSPDKKVGLGFRRLAIVDLSSKAMQPMSYQGRYWIVFNGEIYNYKKLKQEFDENKFISNSDTEVILAMYQRYGVKCLEHLEGMFSLAIYDDEDKTLFAARDRLGKKPFKYYIDDKVLLFSSELKAILTQDEYCREPDFEAINSFLTLQFVPSPLTGFKGIKKLEPGHFLFLDLKTKKLIKKKYWEVDYQEKWDLPEPDWEKKILDCLTDAVETRMVADVPVGAFLSGGVDSSAVVAIMSRLSASPIKTFSVGFGDEKYDELKYAKMVAKKFATDHHELVVSPASIDILPILVKQYEEPFADNSAVPTYLISQMAKKEVTVVLNGDGGDENFGGYDRYSKWQIKTGLKNWWWLSNKFVKNDLERYINSLRYFSSEDKISLTTDYFKSLINNDEIFNERVKNIITERIDPNDKILAADLMAYLPDDLMVKVDMAAMLVAVEARSPFLDKKVVELAAKIPFKLKVKGINNKKYILRETFRGMLPDEVLDRPKMGFGMPLDKWFREDLVEYSAEILLSKKALNRGLFNKEYICELLSKHGDSRIDGSGKIWILLILELWFREYFD